MVKLTTFVGATIHLGNYMKNATLSAGIEHSKILIVEDELLIAEHILKVLKSVGYFNLFLASNVGDALEILNEQAIDLVLTDIMLEGDKSGIDLGILLQNTEDLPLIYITSHTSNGIVQDLFQTRPSAYLSKPFKKEDLIVAVGIALLDAQKVKSEKYVQVKDGHATTQLVFKDINWLEAEGNYTQIHLTSGKKRLIRSSITELFEQLPENDFIRIHRSFVVNKHRISVCTASFVVVAETKLLVGRTFKDQLVDFKKSSLT